MELTEEQRKQIQEEILRKYAEGGGDKQALADAQSENDRRSFVNRLSRFGKYVGNAIKQDGGQADYSTNEANDRERMARMAQARAEFADAEKKKAMMGQYLAEKYDADQRTKIADDRYAAEQAESKRRWDAEQEAARQRLEWERSKYDKDTEAKKKEAEAKAAEMTQAERGKMALYDVGKKAHDQYEAVIRKGGYKPENSGQWIDNSSWAPNILKDNDAITAQAAADSWIESFLRDASGAAIKDDERPAYKRIYFPEPGDPPEVVANKKALREAKMEAALMQAGGKVAPEMSVTKIPIIGPDGGVVMATPEQAEMLLKNPNFKIKGSITPGSKPALQRPAPTDPYLQSQTTDRDRAIYKEVFNG